MMTKQEEGIFLMVFNRSGYVLNFSTNNFDVFTQQYWLGSVGKIGSFKG